MNLKFIPMQKLVPEYWENIEEMQAIFNAENLALEELVKCIHQVKDNMFLMSMDNGMTKRWEHNLLMFGDSSQSLNDRRINVQNELMSSKKLNSEVIKRMFAQYEYLIPSVIFRDSTIIVSVDSSGGFPPNLDRVDTLLEQRKPSHIRLRWDLSLTATKSQLKIGTLATVGEYIDVYPLDQPLIESKATLYMKPSISSGGESIDIYPKEE